MKAITLAAIIAAVMHIGKRGMSLATITRVLRAMGGHH